MHDIEFLALLELVENDQACIALIYSSNEPSKEYLIELLESRRGLHTIETFYKLGNR